MLRVRPFPFLAAPTRARLVLLLLLGAGLALPARDARAQPAASPTPASSQAASHDTQGPVDEFNRGTPESSVRGFLAAVHDGDRERAAHFLDLRQLRGQDADTRGASLALQLGVVLEQTVDLRPGIFSDRPAGRLDDGLPPDRELLQRLETSDGPVGIVLARVARSDGVPIWLFSSDTVALVPALYGEFGYGRLGEILPSVFFRTRWLGLQLWQWLGLIAAVAGAALLSFLVVAVVLRILRPLIRRSASSFDDRLLSAASRPARLSVTVFAFSAAKLTLGLPLAVRERLAATETTLLVVAATWFLLRLTDEVTERLQGRLVAHQQLGLLPLLRPGRRTAKVAILALALVLALGNFGFNVTTLIAGLGVGGVALALAAQRSLENFFGAIALFSDQPVRVGDFCRFGDRVGTVEEIGLRSTRLRTHERTVVAIPNNDFAALQLENFAARDRVWYHPTLGLRYDTSPAQMRQILAALRDMLVEHPRVADAPMHVRFVGFGASSLDVEIFAYVATGDFEEFLAVAEELNLRCMDIVSAAGADFAFPSVTAYLENGRTTTAADARSGPHARNGGDEARRETRHTRRGAL